MCKERFVRDTVGLYELETDGSARDLPLGMEVVMICASPACAFSTISTEDSQACPQDRACCLRKRVSCAPPDCMRHDQFSELVHLGKAPQSQRVDHSLLSPPAFHAGGHAQISQVASHNSPRCSFPNHKSLTRPGSPTSVACRHQHSVSRYFRFVRQHLRLHPRSPSAVSRLPSPAPQSIPSPCYPRGLFTPATMPDPTTPLLGIHF